MADNIIALGDALDDVEHEFNRADEAEMTMAEGLAAICARHYRTRNAYFGAIRQPLLAAVDALEQDERAISFAAWGESHHAMIEARQRLDELNAAGPDFYGVREHCDAEAMSEHAEAIEAILWHRLQSRRRDERAIQAARKAGNVKRVRKSPSEYRMTGKHVTRDGVNVPIVERDR